MEVPMLPMVANMSNRGARYWEGGSRNVSVKLKLKDCW
jgi:hypothetical protein